MPTVNESYDRCIFGCLTNRELKFQVYLQQVPSFIITNNNNNNFYLGLDQLQFPNLLNLKLKKKKIFEVSIIMKLIFFFFFEKQTHTQEREKEILTQRHTTTLLKSHDNF